MSNHTDTDHSETVPFRTIIRTGSFQVGILAAILTGVVGALFAH